MPGLRDTPSYRHVSLRFTRFTRFTNMTLRSQQR